jgi:UTP--glucose-1-phosphate uridylyltransferase
MNVSGVIEKPHPSVAPSTMAITGRYILVPEVFDQIRAQAKGVNGEIQLTDGIAGLLNSQKILAYQYEGRRFDCGSKLGLLQANVILAQTHPELGADFSAWLHETLQATT